MSRALFKTAEELNEFYIKFDSGMTANELDEEYKTSNSKAYVEARDKWAKGEEYDAHQVGKVFGVWCKEFGKKPPEKKTPVHERLPKRKIEIVTIYEY